MHPVSLLRVREEEACAYTFDMCSPLACDALPRSVQQELLRQRESSAALGREGEWKGGLILGCVCVCEETGVPPALASRPVTPPAHCLCADMDGMDGGRAVEVAQRLLQPLTGTCVIRHEGWWSYELCLGRRAQQFHVERPSGSASQSEGGTVTARFLLGKDSGEGQPRLGLTAAGYPHVSQWLEEGTPCDISATPRRTQVLMFCNERAPAGGGGDEPLELGANEVVERLRAMRGQSGPEDAPPPPQPLPQVRSCALPPSAPLPRPAPLDVPAR